jgi:leucyl aminopeptidase
MSLPQLNTTEAPLETLDVDVVVVGLHTVEGALQVSSSGLAPDTVATLLELALRVGATSATSSTSMIPAPENFACATIVFTGLGSSELSVDSVRAAAGYAALSFKKISTAAIALTPELPGLCHAAAEGALIGAHRLVAVGREPEGVLTSLTVGGSLTKGEKARAVAHAHAVWQVRDLVALPPNILNPATFVERVSAMATKTPVVVEVLDEVALLKQGFGGLTAVGQGSVNPPRLMVLRYTPASPQGHIALVGKGITFDSGGLSLKPANSMVGMKYDMTGAAVVSAAILAIAELGLSQAVTAWVCLAENMPSGSASRPNDVITIKGGKTVEILNTDAEGRLVLADGLVAASAENPDVIIDVATLTGAARVALGERYAGLMGHPDAVSMVEQAASAAGELVWAMPLPPELRSLLDTDSADIANAKPGNTLGGMLLAGLFLKEFVGQRKDGSDIPWAHLDIAGPAENSSGAFGYTPKGPTGALVRTVIHLVEATALRSK